MNKIEMGVIKFIIARYKSKSPEGYAIVTRICGVLTVLMGGYIFVYNGIVWPANLAHIAGVVDNLCIVGGAALSALGLATASTTTDPALLSNATKQNVIDEATKNN